MIRFSNAKLTFNPLAFILCSSLVCINTAAQASTEPLNKQNQFTPMQVNVPVGDKFDWLQLNSNELLKGEIKYLYGNKLEFKSDQLNTLVVDWEDVIVLQSRGAVSIGFMDLSTRTGRLLIQDGQGYLDGVAFDVNDIITIISGEQQEANYWSSSISLGANLRSGNNEQIDYSAKARISRRTTESRFRSDYLGNYSKSGDENTTNNHRVNSFFDWFLSNQFFLRPVFAEYYTDPFMNTSSRVTLGSGVGYSIIDTAKTEWSISGGPAYTMTQFKQVEVGEDDNDNSGTLVIDSTFTTELSDDIDFNADYRMQLGNQNSGGYTHHALAGIVVELTDLFDLDLSLVWDRTNNPRAETDGQIPEKNDFQLIIGFGVDI
ncbi:MULTISPECIES: DUF481 domain-containing protein [Pseudomonadati]|uniref:DUF481 domain-containing protein n=1 Tax=Shewanella aestuarii TaxID=1028752 RepID=A0ABT0KYA8_9GAMM|nr:DUF481 domain-containing protein [Shewanella aestuarii]MCL1116385.1 DUF481 domain-containing protein [Shewanella aestuarii]GGN82276.1 hypothetical protein GCM10009193_29230 [Shewanella aestuarii]